MASTFILGGETHLLLLPILLLFTILFLILKHKSSKIPPLPPGPYSWPIIGNLLQIGTKPHDAFAQLAQVYGPLISFRLGTQLVVIASSPAAATEILKTNDRLLTGRHVPHAVYAKSPDMNHVSLGWTFECTEQWKLLRTLCKNGLFTTKIINNQFDLREKKVQELVHFLSSKGGEIDVKIGEVVFASVFNFLGNVFFSKDFIEFDEKGEDGEKMSGLVREMVELLTSTNISDLYPILGGLDLQGIRRKTDECINKISSLWEGIIRERRECKGVEARSHGDFLDVLLDNDFSDDQMNYLFLELFTAGTDTTTSTIEWTMAELIKNQQAMWKVRDEFQKAEIPETFLGESHLHKLTYLHACVKETLRLHPPVPLLLPRSALVQCQVMNYTIPKDTQVLVNVWAIGRDPQIWDDPLSFRPERFMSCELDFKGNDFEFLPFGGGRRICPGLPMAIRQVHLIVASLINHFEWTLPHNMVPHQLDMNEKFGITLHKEQPLVLKLKRRVIVEPANSVLL